MNVLFAASVIGFGSLLALRAWFAGGLPRLGADRALDVQLSPRDRTALDLTLSLVIVAFGVAAAVA